MHIQYVFIICDLVLLCLTCAHVLFQFDFDTFSEQVGDFKWLEARKAASADQAEVLSAARKLGKNQVTSTLICACYSSFFCINISIYSLQAGAAKY